MSDYDDPIGKIFAAVMGLFTIGFIGFCGYVVGCAVTTTESHAEAIEHRAAEWTIDPKTGIRQFTWINAPESKP